jgi:hypothetical protein
MAGAKEFPYIVQILVPPGGLGEQLEEMLTFQRNRGITLHPGKGRRVRGGVIYAGALPLPTAIEFAVKFGGRTSH